MTKSCETCQGNGEIVTDWDRYKNPRPGDVGDEAVAECPDCNGEGEVSEVESHGVEVWLCGTIYVDAESEEDAEKIVAKRYTGTRETPDDLMIGVDDISIWHNESIHADKLAPITSIYGLASDSKLVPEADPVRDAAPDMLAALKLLEADFGADFKGPTIDAMRAAIAKAEGGAA